MNEVATVEAPHNSIERITITKVDNGYLVENQDKHWQGKRTVHLDLDGVLEVVKNVFNG